MARASAAVAVAVAAGTLFWAAPAHAVLPPPDGCTFTARDTSRTLGTISFSVSGDTCGWPVEAAVDSYVCQPAAPPSTSCSAPVWNYGNAVTSGTTSVKVYATETYSKYGYRYKSPSGWHLVVTSG